ncbi:MAG: hypothetical protein FJ301_08235 [Planctomycetes bacterium]|nr:hypothetical protein [Planctomycetota bacterium]
MHLPRLALVLVGAASVGAAQSNAVPGTDVYLYDVSNSTIYGRRGPAYPNGEVGIGFGHAFCNKGTVHIPWQTSPTTSGQMTDIHFKIAFLLARESNGRIVQVSLPNSYVKHSRVTYNLGSSQCGTCQTGPASTFRIGCYDAYSTGFNGDRFNLGPASEIDPWTGSWNPVGSYFDRGDPMVAGAAANDGVQSLTSAQVLTFDTVKNRVTVPESELSQPGTFYGQVHLVCEGEPLAARGDNLLSERLNFTWSGTAWSTSNAGGPVAGSVLNRWVGATRNTAGNGLDDGRFLVAAKVTGPVNGLYHYEYAVHNIDNARGGASLKIPLHPSAELTAVGFRDIDGNVLNDWALSRSGGELSFLASANNSLDWNSIYNVWFDSNVAPTAGSVVIDQARIGPGALSVTVASDVPNGALSASVATLGTGCFGLGLTATRPVLGTTAQITTTGIPAGTPLGVTVLSLTPTPAPIDLAVIGMPTCFAHVSGGVNEVWLNPVATAQVPLVVPSNTALIGLPVGAQSLSASPPLTPLGFIASNGVLMVVGAQ